MMLKLTQHCKILDTSQVSWYFLENFSKKYHETADNMLIEFSVANFRSFYNSQTLSLVKGKGDELPDNAFEVKAICIMRCNFKFHLFFNSTFEF